MTGPRAHEAAIRSRRGQKLLRDLLQALDAMAVKELIANSFITPSGRCCALGALGLARGIDPEDLGALTDDHAHTAKLFGTARSLIIEIETHNDYMLKSPTPAQRWAYMRDWVASKITAAE